MASDPNLIGTDNTSGNPGIESAQITASTAPGVWLPYTAQGTAPAGTTNVQVLDSLREHPILVLQLRTARRGAAWCMTMKPLNQVTGTSSSVTLGAFGAHGMPLTSIRRRSTGVNIAATGCCQ